jgi:putative flippase GtrA
MVGQMNGSRVSKLGTLLRELLGYGAASAIALAVDTGVLAGLVELAGWHYVSASVVGFVCGSLVAYTLSVRFVFQQRRLPKRSLELTWFLVLGVAGIAVNTLVLSVAIGMAGLGLLTAKFCAAGCTFATNFALRRNLLFAANVPIGS